MFSQTFLPYITAVSALDLGSDLKNKLVAIAVASAVANELDVPATKVESAEQTFESMQQNRAYSFLSDFNEAAVLNVRYAKELVRKFWLLRYYAVHGTQFFMVTQTNRPSYFESFLQVGRFFSIDEINLMNDNAETLCKLGIQVDSVLYELGKD